MIYINSKLQEPALLTQRVDVGRGINQQSKYLFIIYYSFIHLCTVDTSHRGGEPVL